MPRWPVKSVKVVRIYQTVDRGRWVALIECPDGVVRRFAAEHDKVAAVRPRRKLRRPVKLRFDVLARDNYTCRYCGRKAPDVVLVIDHVVPFSAGGTDEPSNLVTACEECNSGKSSRHSGGIVEPRDELYTSAVDRARAAMEMAFLPEMASSMATDSPAVGGRERE